MTKPGAAWKNLEKQAARILGGERVSTAKLGQSCPDFETPVFVGETKLRAELPRWFTEPLRKTELHAAGSGKIPLVLWKEKGKRTGSALAVLRLKDLEDLTGRIAPPREPED